MIFEREENILELQLLFVYDFTEDRSNLVCIAKMPALLAAAVFSCDYSV